MPFTAEEIANINASTLENYIDKGTVWKQNIANKPLLADFNASAGKFNGGNVNVSFAVSPGQGGGGLVGYTGDDQVTFYNPTTTKRTEFPWKEHHIGIQVTHTELKIDGIEVDEDGADQEMNQTNGREDFALANLLDEKNDALGEDFAFSLDRLLHNDGTADTKALAGLQSIILDNPGAGSTGNISRTNTWWQNRAATAAFADAGGQGPITSAATGGGVLITFLENEWPFLTKFAKGTTRRKIYAGSDFIAALKSEMRANGHYTQDGWGAGTVDPSMGNVRWKGTDVTWDPTLDDLGFAKRMYVLDMSKTGLRLLYFNGKRMQKHNPARPYDRYVMYNGITTTAVLVAKQLNTSGVYDIT